MPHYKLIVAYDGTAYHGWQAQKEVPSVAQTIQTCFQSVFNRPIVLRGASRTDAGVHALGQVAAFMTDLTLEPATIMRALNNVLPDDIVIRSAVATDDTENIFQHIEHKIYYYHLFVQQPFPFVSRYGWHVRKSFDYEKLQAALPLFQGTHDFRSFASSEDTRENTVRTIYTIHSEYFARFKAYRISVVGPAFLRHMIRRIVGACVEVASRPELPLSLLSEQLRKKDPEHMLPNAPAQGLLLYKIVYRAKNIELTPHTAFKP
jgi:tRNA pseudouridine38-40 synthase